MTESINNETLARVFSRYMFGQIHTPDGTGKLIGLEYHQQIDIPLIRIRFPDVRLLTPYQNPNAKSKGTENHYHASKCKLLLRFVEDLTPSELEFLAQLSITTSKKHKWSIEKHTHANGTRFSFYEMTTDTSTHSVAVDMDGNVDVYDEDQDNALTASMYQSVTTQYLLSRYINLPMLELGGETPIQAGIALKTP